LAKGVAATCCCAIIAKMVIFWNELLISRFGMHNVVTHYVGIQNDVTERLKAEEERNQTGNCSANTAFLFPKNP
jgi:disulfide oxidoreductase YuzD